MWLLCLNVCLNIPLQALWNKSIQKKKLIWIDWASQCLNKSWGINVSVLGSSSKSKGGLETIGKDFVFFDEYFFNGQENSSNMVYSVHRHKLFLVSSCRIIYKQEDMSILSQNFEIGIIFDMWSRLYRLPNIALSPHLSTVSDY